MSANLFTFWGNSFPDPYRGFAPGSHWGTCVAQIPWTIAPSPNNNFWCEHWELRQLRSLSTIMLSIPSPPQCDPLKNKHRKWSKRWSKRCLDSYEAQSSSSEYSGQTADVLLLTLRKIKTGETDSDNDIIIIRQRRWVTRQKRSFN